LSVAFGGSDPGRLFTLVVELAFSRFGTQFGFGAFFQLLAIVQTFFVAFGVFLRDFKLGAFGGGFRRGLPRLVFP
jgi:hypothetical protein